MAQILTFLKFCDNVRCCWNYIPAAFRMGRNTANIDLDRPAAVVDILNNQGETKWRE